MGRTKKKPGYDQNRIMEQFQNCIVEAYTSGMIDGSGISLRQVSEEFGITLMKTRKILITAGVYHTENSEKINSMREQGMSIPEIMKATGLGVSMVSLYENSKDMEFIAVYVLDSGMGSVSASFLLMFFANIVGSSTASAKALTYLGRHTLFLMSFDYFSDFISVRVLQIFRVHNWLFSFCGKVLVLVIGLQLLQLAIKVIPNESAKKFLSKY